MKPREYIWQTVYKVVSDHGYANLILRNMPEMPAADRAFVSETVYGTLRNYDFLSYQWQDLTERPVRKQTEALLNMSVYQLQYLDRVPDYAVISEAVDLAPKREKKLVNAVLRKVQKRGRIAPAEGDALKDAAVMYSHPLWLLKMWKAHYGEENALRIAAHDQTRPRVYGRINTLKMRREELEKNEGICFLNEISFTWDGVLSSTEWFRNGEVLIQDAASAQIPLQLDVKPGMRVLDACASPGTKTQEIAMLMENRGEIIAGDLHPHRVGLITQLMEKTGTKICRAEERDAAENEDHSEYDRILLDVPCSGLGDLRGKPEIRMHITPEGIDELVILQKKILARSARNLKKGGLLVYSTCTLNRKENEQQIRSFLDEHPSFVLKKEKTIFPWENDTDGFYFAQLEKI